MSDGFRVLATAHFARLFERLEKAHPELAQYYQEALTILSSDPHNRTRTHPIRKLVNVPAGDGQYRLRLGRWRFRYDIDEREVLLKRCSLRREDTYR